MHALRTGLFALSILAVIPAAHATSAPAAACASMGASERDSDLVLGHFRGGRIVRAENGVPLIVWKDEYTCFTSRHVCEAWQRTMNVAWRNVEGDRTCLPIR